MILKPWKKLFSPQILSRGWEYYDAELVTIDSMDEEYIEATVEGTEPYEVTIVLENGSVRDMSCSCPYAADGKNCKHMAAVLYTVAEEKDEDYLSAYKEQADAEKEKLEKELDSLTEEQLRALLLQAALRHQDVQDRIAWTGQKEAGAAAKKAWAEEIKRIAYEASDCDGFISYYRAREYEDSLLSFLYDTIDPLRENGLVMDAFELVGMVLFSALSQDIDDSDGELSSISSSCTNLWKKLIADPEADQKRMFRYLAGKLRQSKNDGFTREILISALSEYFTDESLLPDILALVDKQIGKASDYELPILIERRIELMKRMRLSPEEIHAYRQSFWKYPFIRRQELDEMEQEGRYMDALALLLICEDMDQKEPHLLAEYAKRRVQILEKSGPRLAYEEALKKYVFSFYQRDLTYILKLKEITAQDKWPGLREKLFQSPTTKWLRHEIQLSDGLIETLLQELEQEETPRDILKYEKELRKQFPERTRDLLLRLYREEMKTAGSRTAYADIIRDLKKLYGYPEGRAKVKSLALSWRKTYIRRTALLDELDKAGL